MKKYDYVLVEPGSTAAYFAYLAAKQGKKCLVVERRNHLGGNVYCEEIEGIHVHKYGAHIFHTSNKKVWDFVNELAEFNRYTNSPMANFKGQMYNMPFNMNTFSKMWGISTPAPGQIHHRGAAPGHPGGAEEPGGAGHQPGGVDIYRKLVKGYTEKQWGRECRDLPAFIIKRLPVRYTYDNNYFNDRYQGIPMGGYNVIIEKLFADCDVELEKDYLQDKEYYDSLGETVIYTGTIDGYFGYCYGKLEYRSLRFETEVKNRDNYQGVAVVKLHRPGDPLHQDHRTQALEFGTQEKTVITREYPVAWKEGMEPYYPVNDEKNQALYQKYAELAAGRRMFASVAGWESTNITTWTK